MNIIYEPRGRAKEYSDLACNLYMGCSHGCRYCFAPACMRKSADEWHNTIVARKNAILLFEKDAATLFDKRDKRHILFSFLSDPYQPLERTERLTHQALQIVQRYRLNSKILTKGSIDLIQGDLSLMKKARTQLGITVCFVDDSSRAYWEPNASPADDRLELLKEAHNMGIYTWVSLEPVIDPEQALEVIRKAAPYVDMWKVGKLNHMKSEEGKVDWYKFRIDVEALLKNLNAKYYIKEDLMNAKPSKNS